MISHWNSVPLFDHLRGRRVGNCLEDKLVEEECDFAYLKFDFLASNMFCVDSIVELSLNLNNIQSTSYHINVNAYGDQNRECDELKIQIRLLHFYLSYLR